MEFKLLGNIAPPASKKSVNDLSDAAHYLVSHMPGHLAYCIKDWAEANTPFTTSSLLLAIGVPQARLYEHAKTLSTALRKMGYKPVRKKVDGGRPTFWVPNPLADLDDPKPATSTGTGSVGAWIEMQRGPFDLRTAFKGIEGHYSHSEREAVTMDLKLIKIGCGKATTKYGVVYFPPKYKGSI